jgi:homocysteine S-methyltransferase
MEPTKPLHDLFASGKPVLADGAMGTLLNQRGIGYDYCFDELNITRPALVAEIHREYIEAGAQIIQTNTFGANRYKLQKHGLDKQLEKINASAVDLARRVIMASFSKVLIAGDIGPLGVRLAPFGRVQPEEARQAFTEQINALVSAGVDLIIIETMTDLYEVREAIQAAREVAPAIPIIASMTYTRDDRTLLGDTPVKVARSMAEFGADVLGVNCSGGPDQILRILRQMRQAVPDSYFSVMPNAGWPQQTGGRIMYPASPEYFREYAIAFWQAGANIIGGCCGTTPQHIAIMREKLESTTLDVSLPNGAISVLESDEVSAAQSPTNFASRLRSDDFLITVEMDPPRGLSTNKVIAGASLIAEAGADVINVADSPMARMRMSPWAVCNIIQKEVKIETVLHFPTRGRNLLRVQGDLLAAHSLNVRNIFVVMGDPTAIGDYPDAMDNYDLVPSGLIKLIKQGFNAGFDHAGAEIGQPTSFVVGCALDLNPGRFNSEIKNIQKKILAGADFILTQPIYDTRVVEEFFDRYEAIYGPMPIPVFVGILPLANYRHATFLHHEVPGITIPDDIRSKMEKSGGDDPTTGIAIARDMILELKELVRGVYLIPAFNRYDHIAEIIETIKQHDKDINH